MTTINNQWIGIILILSSIIMAFTIYLITQFKRWNKRSDIIGKEKIEKEKQKGTLPIDIELTSTSKETSRVSEDLSILNIEKEIISYALTHLYEAEAEGKITYNDRVNLVNKYSAEMQRLEEQIDERKLIVTLNELENAQEDVVKRLTNEFDNIEGNLEALPKEKNDLQTKSFQEVNPKGLVEQKVESNPSTVMEDFNKNKAEEKIKNIQDEVLKILERLEKLEIEP